MIRLEARPEPVAIDPRRTAMLVIERLFGWVSNARAVIDALARQAQLV